MTMSQPHSSEPRLPHDPAAFACNMAKVAEQSQAIVQEFIARQKKAPSLPFDPMGVSAAFLQMCAKMMADPAGLMEKQADLWKDYWQLWQHAAEKFLGMEDETPPPAAAQVKDKRFKDPAWQENTVFDFIRQSYLLTSHWMQSMVAGVEGLDAKDARKLDFYTRQFIDAMSPSNFLLTNPEVLKTTLATNGENLVKGLQQLLADLERGGGSLHVSMTDYSAFEIGRNLATTPGKVVFQNDLMQLLQYAPMTKEAHRTPMLLIPAWINKFYILDMQSENSLVRWLVEQGHTVFVISWANPDEALSHKTFDDYLLEGPLAAIDAIERATGEKQVNITGYCLGGTLLSIFLSWLHAKGQESRVKSATYFTTMTDFSDAGEISVFIDEEQLKSMEARMKEKGYLEGGDMAMTFNLLRANDLIWSFVVSNYLLGKDPFPFDLLYWNADSTRMPAAMHSFYLRNMYLDNKLIQPGGITVAGEAIDLRRVKTPTMMLSAREDHIAPWKSTYAGTQIFGGEVDFVLAASGHIAGMINPPARKKYSYWCDSDKAAHTAPARKAHPADPDAWFAGAKERPGSWWPHWNAWLKPHAGEMVAARQPGEGKLKAIEDAPGSYVKAK